MNANKLTEMRIKKLLLSDKIKAYDGFVEMLKSDIYKVAESYMQIKSIKIDIDATENSNYLIDIKLQATNIISPSSTI